ncbi:unnamed protein product, partial [Mesorhabditis belari]|uniref:Uncharacterized protein n=1 Tax=Mesorhabditis belari TaxID=2138241 RepID=A0AAF3JAW1_9BILA
METKIFAEPYIYLCYDRLLLVVGFPISIYTLCVIFWKTPKEMREYKNPLLATQIFSLGLDVTLLSTRPELMFPACAGRMFSIWNWLFEIEAKHAFACGAFFLICVVSSATTLFFLKLQSLLDMSNRFKLSTFWKSLFLLPLFTAYPFGALIMAELFSLDKGVNTTNFQEMIQQKPDELVLAIATPRATFVHCARIAETKLSSGQLMIREIEFS